MLLQITEENPEQRPPLNLDGVIHIAEGEQASLSFF